MQPFLPVYCSGKCGRNVYREISVIVHGADKDAAAEASLVLLAPWIDSRQETGFVSLPRMASTRRLCIQELPSTREQGLMLFPAPPPKKLLSAASGLITKRPCSRPVLVLLWLPG